jgi:CBS domain-containing protein
MLVGAIMTPSPINIGASASILDASKLMLDNRVNRLPVVDDNGVLVGVITEGDFLRRHELDTDRKRSWLHG